MRFGHKGQISLVKIEREPEPVKVLLSTQKQIKLLNALGIMTKGVLRTPDKQET